MASGMVRVDVGVDGPVDSPSEKLGKYCMRVTVS